MLHVLQGLSLPEQQLEKLCYTLDTLHQKLEELGFELQTLEGALRSLRCKDCKQKYGRLQRVKSLFLDCNSEKRIALCTEGMDHS